MKVIKKPENAEHWKHQFTCTSCECVLEIETDDLKHTFDQRDGDTFYVACSICQTRYILSTKDIPKYVQTMVKRRPTVNDYYDR